MWDKALSDYNKAIELSPQNAAALSNRGNVLRELGRLSEAASDHLAAIRISPRIAEAHNNLGLVYGDKSEWQVALDCFDRALSLKPQYFEALTNRGNALLELNRLDEALASYDKAISLKPDYAEAYSNRGNVLLKLKRLDEALASHNKAISFKPDYAEAHSNRGNTLLELNRLEEALASHDKAVNLRPDYAEAYGNRGNALLELNRLDEALASYDKAISLDPVSAEAYSNRGHALLELNRLDEALESYDKAISLKPDFAEIYYNRGNALKELKRRDEALASYDKAISLKPDYAECSYNKALLLLGQQDFQDGFNLYQWRWKTKDFDSRPLNTTIPAWNGSSYTGKLLLWTEQGIGDEIFYSSMIPLISHDISVTLSADKRLHSLYARSFPHLNLIDRAVQEQPVNGGFEAQAAIGDLGNLLKVSSATLKQRRHPLLVVSQERTQAHLLNNEFLRKKPVCGVAWKSANKKFGDKKSITLQDLKPLLTTGDVTFVNLQYGDVTTEITQVAEETGITIEQATDLDVFNDIDGLLSLIEACDIVFTTSNVTAHLAGAIGKKAAVLVPAGKGRLWYWHNEPQSIWYPSLRLFSQNDRGDWSIAISEAAQWIRENI